MRERLTEFLPLLLAGVVLLLFQLSRSGWSMLPFTAAGAATPTPSVEVAGARPIVVARRPTPMGLVRQAQPESVCNAAQPRFTGGIAELNAVLGASMGDPLECEQLVNDRGDTHQKTTTG